MISNEIQVLTVRNRPTRFQWNHLWYSITSIEDEWVDTGEWWNGEGEKSFYRVNSSNRIFEIYYDEKEKTWYMYKVYD